MKKYISLFAMILTALPCLGGAQPFNVILSSSGVAGSPTVYVIPAGKVFILEAVHLIAASGGAPTTTTIAISRKMDNVSTTLNMKHTVADTFTSADTVILKQSLRVKAGEILVLPHVGTYSRCVYIGLMIDDADLYAANIPVELKNTRVVGGKLLADAKLASPRPHKLTIQSATTDLSAFIYDPTGSSTSTTNPTTKVVSVDKGSADKKFLRVMATTRSK